MSNVHPWFANVSVEEAAGWTNTFFQEQNVAVANTLSNKPQMFIAETGWPTKSSDAGNESNGPSTASVSGLQTFLDTFVCQANQNGTGYFYFEVRISVVRCSRGADPVVQFFDETWKDQEFGGVEGHWGLFYSKCVVIGICHTGRRH